MNADALCEALRSSRGFLHKRDVSDVMGVLQGAACAARCTAAAVPLGDDCAAIPDGDGYLLFAIEGFVEDFVNASPWFAGYCGVMVNVSDIYAMGGRPLAVVDALWSRDEAAARPVLDGLAQAAAAYGVPIVGGHSNTRTAQEQLAVAVLGRARRLLTSFDAVAGDVVLAAIDLRGRYREPNSYWDASSAAASAGLGVRLRGDLEILPWLAEQGLCRVAKDISQAGVIGTAVMLAEASGIGMQLRPDAIPCPPGAPLARWLLSFPSYGFLLAAAAADTAPIIAAFAARDIACAVIGRCEPGSRVTLALGDDTATVWDLATQKLTGCGRGTPSKKELLF